MTSAPHRAVFLDRDGVLNASIVRDGTTHPPDHPDDFALLPGVVEACQELKAAGLSLVVVTNQPDVARGQQDRSLVEAINDLVCAALPVLDVLTCYHDAADGCACRKPKPGMLQEASRCWGIDLKKSFMVGDRWSDVQAGQAVGCLSVLIVTPYSHADRCRPDYQARDLAEAARWILYSLRRE